MDSYCQNINEEIGQKDYIRPKTIRTGHQMIGPRVFGHTNLNLKALGKIVDCFCGKALTC